MVEPQFQRRATNSFNADPFFYPLSPLPQTRKLNFEEFPPRKCDHARVFSKRLVLVSPSRADHDLSSFKSYPISL